MNKEVGSTNEDNTEQSSYGSASYMTVGVVEIIGAAKAAIGFVEKYGGLVKFILGFIGSDDRKWLEEALKTINFKLDQIIEGLAELTERVEQIRAEIQETPRRTLHLLIQVQLRGLLGRFETLSEGDEKISGDRLRLLDDLNADAFRLSHEIAGSPRDMALLAPTVALLAPLAISTSRLREGGSKELRLGLLRRFMGFVEISLDEKVEGSLAWVTNERSERKTALEGLIQHSSRSLIKKQWFYDDGDKVHYTVRINFSGDPEKGYKASSAVLEDRVVEPWTPPPPPTPTFQHNIVEAEPAINKSSLIEQWLRPKVLDVVAFASAREDQGHKETASRKRAEKRIQDTISNELKKLEKLSASWRVAKAELDIAEGALKITVQLPELLNRLAERENG